MQGLVLLVVAGQLWVALERVPADALRERLDVLAPRLAAEIEQTLPATWPLRGDEATDAVPLALVVDGLARLAGETGTRLSLLGPDGRLVADSTTPATEAERGDQRYHREVAGAFATGVGRSVREQPPGRRAVLHARRLGPAEAPLGVLRASVPLDGALLSSEIGRLRTWLATGTLAALAAGLLCLWASCRSLGSIIGRIGSAGRAFARGELDHRVAPPPVRELELLAEISNRMAAQLDRRLDELQSQRAEQRAILQSMSAGMIALDRGQCVLSANRGAIRLLDLPRSEIRGRLLHEIVRLPELHRFVETMLARDATPEPTDEIDADDEAVDDRAMDLAVGGAILRVVGEPLVDPDAGRVGLLLLVQDVTTLRRLESLRRDFAANVSHELRTPITNIKGYVETLRELAEDARNDEAVRFLGVVDRNARRLEAIIEDLLTLADLEREGAPVRPPASRGSAHQLVDTVVGQFEDAAAEKRITLRVAVAPGLEVEGGLRLLEQALANLLSNAIRYSPEGTEVRVEAATHDAGHLALSVRDQGPGIAAEHLPRLFERFYRVDQARSRSLGGTGLGLAIVKHIANVHGGRAEVESRPGEGSLFRIVLPRPERVGPEAQS